MNTRELSHSHMSCTEPTDNVDWERTVRLQMQCAQHGAYISQASSVARCVASRGGTSGKGDSSVESNGER